ncbi:hypothetical protein CMV_017378 [Castanea mollissima]|uniref:Uncharacterized protein n=1 Tax=Castanea mollissima TaxID=60419 RepID=A0A8J4VH80_9ROSI|nr:hypothetical protein CMV_017378 [Castanea mollissima]
MQVTKGTSEDELSLSTSSLKGTKQFFLVESHSAGISWVASRSDSGNPSGIVSNRKSGAWLIASWVIHGLVLGMGHILHGAL